MHYNGPMKTLGIIGGGAAGLAAAIKAGECARAAGMPLRISVLERDDRVGRSILATGNGRCNFSNAYIDTAQYFNSEFVESVLDALAALEPRDALETLGPLEPRENREASCSDDAVHAFFRRFGLVWRQEGDGRQYPLANKASVVVDVLRAAAHAVGVEELREAEVSSIDPPRAPGKPYTLRLKDGAFKRYDALIVACGGRGAQQLLEDLVPFNRMRPVLGPLKTNPEYPRMLENIRVRCRVSLERKSTSGTWRTVASEAGELMFRKYGVSGIAVFNLSRFAWASDRLTVNFLGDATQEEAERLLRERARSVSSWQAGRPTCADVLRGLVLPRVAEVLCKNAQVATQTAFSDATAAALAHQLTAFPLEVTGIGDPDNCQVRRGGVQPSALSGETCGVLALPGLYVAGEAVDIDGPCGGYNLHWAWASGMAAGADAVRWLAAGKGANRA